MKINLLTLLVIITFLRAEKLNSQILFSSIIEDAFLLSPESIDLSCEEISFKYIDKIEQHLEKLIVEKQYVDKEITRLRGQTKLQKSEKRALINHEAYLNQINKEITTTDSLNTAWSEYVMQQEVLLDLFGKINNGKCLTIKINGNDYESDELELSKQILRKELEYFESFHTTFIPAGTKWVKKVDENCLSANPDDCLVRCLVETQEHYEITDLSGLKKSFANCPANFKYDGNKGECFTKKSIVLEDSEQEFYTLRIKGEKETMAIRTIDFTEINCID